MNNMGVQLFRIDDRLIHGQVVLGWAHKIGTKRIILCDEEIAENEWERELYMSCVPEGLETLVTTPAKTASFLKNKHPVNEKTIVLVKSPRVALDVTQFGFVPQTINIGGLHYTDRRKKYLSYVFLSQVEIADLRELSQKGITIFCQDVPTGKNSPLWDVVK
jgi:mannose/fructose/N-acetylgalactosamine-specific phosphotransferase system component IIB